MDVVSLKRELSMSDYVWNMPEEVEPYRSLIIYAQQGEHIEDLMNTYFSNVNLLPLDSLMRANAILAQIRLINELHRKRMLRDLSAWKCNTPYIKGAEFCGKPGEHPNFWGCGYLVVD